MKFLISIFSLLIFAVGFTQVKTDEYLKDNRVDLLKENNIAIGCGKQEVELIECMVALDLEEVELILAQ